MDKAMTKDEALTEARKRWGSEAYADNDDTPEVSHVVGYFSSVGGDDLMMGVGASWEEAFANADQEECK